MQFIPLRLKEARRKAGFSQSQMAEMLGVSVNTISAIENGDARELRIGFIHDYARITGETEAFLIFGYEYLEMTLYRMEEAKDVINRTLDTTMDMIRKDRQRLLPTKK